MPTGAAALGVAGVLIGVLIGATGIGGVLLVPFLVHGLKYPVQSAVAVALWSYLWSGLLAIALYWRRGSISAGRRSGSAALLSPARSSGPRRWRSFRARWWKR